MTDKRAMAARFAGDVGGEVAIPGGLLPLAFHPAVERGKLCARACGKKPVSSFSPASTGCLRLSGYVGSSRLRHARAEASELSASGMIAPVGARSKRLELSRIP